MATLHLQMTVEYARGWIKRDIREGRYPRILVNPDGSAAPVEEQLRALDEMERNGMTFVPCGCREVTPDGRCKGIN